MYLMISLFSMTGVVEQRIIHAVSHGGRPDIDEMGSEVPDGVQSLVKQCWAQQPNERPSFVGEAISS